ncbi:MAG: hypothetical protein WCT77_00665 [Bacteroidota bacterium]|jgi:hypothetical protein
MNTTDLFLDQVAEHLLNKIKPVLVEQKAQVLTEVQNLLKIKETSDEALSIPEIKALKKCKSNNTVRSLIRKFGIPNIGIGTAKRYSRKALEEAIAKQNIGDK